MRVLLASYFLGCFTTGYYLVRARTGQDIRDAGSGSVGARNVGRLLGPYGFVLTLLGDFAKGAAAVWITRYFTGNERLALVALIVVVAGHIWPLQLRFRGGKGIATSLGALLVYSPALTLIFAMLIVVGFILTRRTVISGLTAFALLPLGSFFLNQDAAQICGISVLAALVLIAHHKNLAEEIHQIIERRNLQRPKN